MNDLIAALRLHPPGQTTRQHRKALRMAADLSGLSGEEATAYVLAHAYRIIECCNGQASHAAMQYTITTGVNMLTGEAV